MEVAWNELVMGSGDTVSNMLRGEERESESTET